MLFEEITVFQACACGRCCNTEASTSLLQSHTCACAQVRLLPFLSVLPHCCGLSSCALSACTLVDVVTSWLKFDEKNIIHFHGSGAFALTHKILALSCRWNKRTSVWGLPRASSMNCRNSYSEFLQDTRRCSVGGAEDLDA